MIRGDEGLIEFESLCSDSYSILINLMLIILAFITSKSYFINFNIPFYNPLNIKHSIFLQLHLNNTIFILPLSLSFHHFLLNG